MCLKIKINLKENMINFKKKNECVNSKKWPENVDI